jgi:hypothetical protein
VTQFRRFSKRRQRAALLVALLDQLEWGAPEYQTAPMRATQDGFCVLCGTSIVSGRDDIVFARYGPRDERYQTWVHTKCPYLWDVVAGTIERYDDKIITKINRQGRGCASGCGHDVTNRPVYLVRRPVSLDEPDHSAWFCETCVTPGNEEDK